MTFLETDGFTFRAQEELLPHGRRQAVQHLVRKCFQQEGAFRCRFIESTGRGNRMKP